MENLIPKPIEISLEEIAYQKRLKRVNEEIAKLSLTMRYKKIERAIENCEALKGKKVIMVDDLADIIAEFVPELMLATDDNASFLLHTDQTAGELASNILKANPDIVLMDRNLANKVNGADVVGIIMHHNPKIACIGFSSESDSEQEFISAGAKGFVEKDIFNTTENIQSVAKIVEGLN